jgi:Skp family chaperone for outer membrane proteins
VFDIRFAVTAALAATLLSPVIPASAQQSQDYFVPPQNRPAAPARPAARAVTPPATPPAAAAEAAPEPEQQPTLTPQQLEAVLPPAPEVPPVPRGNLPPAAVIGVISVPDVMRNSSAYQSVDKELATRRQKLNEDVQKEQTALRDLGQQLANERAKMTADQIRARERELQDRIAASRRKFADRNRVIQEAGQYALAQIERTLRVVVQQVAVSHGMNLVLHAPQVALNTPEFDITQQVVQELNKVQPSVTIPADGVSVLDLKPVASAPAASQASAKPASGPTKKP